MARRPGLKSMPLSRVESVLRKHRKDQWDLYVPLSSIRLDIKNPLAPLLEERYQLSLQQEADDQQLHFSATSIHQLCQIAGVPTPFMEKVPASLGLKLLRCLIGMSEFGGGRDFLLRLKGHTLASAPADSRSTYIKNPIDEVKRIFREYSLGNVRGKIGRWIVSEVLKELSLFGVGKFHIVQAFTAVARGLQHHDRVRLEDAMGSYILDSHTNVAG